MLISPFTTRRSALRGDLRGLFLLGRIPFPLEGRERIGRCDEKKRRR